jgi:phage-related protein
MTSAREWLVAFHEQAKTEFSELPRGLKGKMLALLKIAEEEGLLKIPPKRRKHISGNIWEFRVNAHDGIARALYITRNKAITVLVVFAKKTQRTPSAMIELAEKRSREV